MAKVKFAFVVQNLAGNTAQSTIPNAAVEVRLQDGGALANIFSDLAGLVPIPQPGAATNSFGTFVFFADFAAYNAISNGQVFPLGHDSSIPENINVNTINESTAEAGVTVENVLIKDGQVDGRNISDDGDTLDALKAKDLGVHEVANPAVNAAVTTLLIDENDGVVITNTTTPNDQTLQDPSVKITGKSFFVMNDSASNDVISVNGQSLQVGEVAIFTFDGALWSIDAGRNSILGSLSTAYVSGLELTINVDPTKFDIAPGLYLVVDAHTNPDAPTVKTVVYPGSTANIVPNLATQDATSIGLDKDGLIVQQEDLFEGEQLRDYAVVGGVIHISRVLIERINRFTAVPSNNVASALSDAVSAITGGGSINKFGSIKVSANGANLFVNRSAGTLFRIGVAPDNFKNQNEMPSPGAVGGATPGVNTTWLRGWTTVDGPGFAFDVNQTAIIPGQYDDGTATIADGGPQGPVPNNRYSMHHLYYEPSGDTMVVQLGVDTYTSIADAEGASANELKTAEVAGLANFLLLGHYIVKGNATVLNDPAVAQVVDGPVFRGASGTGGGATSTTTLQGAINNSGLPQATLGASTGPLQWQTSFASNSTAFMEWLNIAGTVVASFNGNGDLITNDLDVLGDLNVQGTTTTIDTDNLAVKDNIITINKGETGAGVTLGTAGIEVDRGTKTNYRSNFDESFGGFRIGEIGSEQAVATREDSPVDNAVMVYDATTNKMVTSAGFAYENSMLGIGAESPVSKLHVLEQTAGTNDILTIQILERTHATGTLDGFGLQVLTKLDDNDGITRFAMTSTTGWDDVLADKAYWSLGLRNGGAPSEVLFLYSGGDAKITGSMGFNNTPPVAKPTVTGSRGGNAALASLITALAAMGLLTDGTSA